MDRECLVPSSQTSDTVYPEPQWTEQIFIPIKQEIQSDFDEEHSAGSDYMSSLHVNYYDNNTNVFEQVKEELPSDEYPQAADSSESNKIFSKNNKLVNVKDKEKLENENMKPPSNIKQEKENEIYEVTIKLEMEEENETTDNAEDPSVNYDLSGTSQEAQYNCDKTFENSSSVINYNNEQIDMKTNSPPGDNEMKELHRCQYCDENFNNKDDMVAHLNQVHRKQYPKCELCGRQFKRMQGLKCHSLKIHKIRKPPKRVPRNTMKCTYCNLDFKNKLIYNSHMRLCHPAKEITYTCGTCVKLFKSRHSLVVHMKRTHYDFGRMFECWCGEKFRTPIHLTEHKSLQHTIKGQNEEHKCKDCDEVFNSIYYLKIHTQKCHCDSETKFDSDSGSEMPISLLLPDRKVGRHDRPSDITYNGKVKCDYCHRTFTNNSYLMKHIKRIHYDYGKTFKCWCGKEFRTPYHLNEHKGVHNYTNSKVQCDICQKFYKNKFSLAKHKIKIHGDYGRIYKCYCAKEFRTPSELADHKSQQHDNDGDGTGNGKVQCVTCLSFFKTKNGLLRHIKRIHHDYGSKVFKCWCGKVFRTPYHLSSHKSLSHDGKNYGTLNSKVQCGVCQKLYKSNRLLDRHKKRMHCDYDTVF